MKIQKAIRSAKYDDLIEEILQNNFYSTNSLFDEDIAKDVYSKLSKGEKALMTWAAYYLRDNAEKESTDFNLAYNVCYDYTNEYAKIFSKTIKNNKRRQAEFYIMIHNLFLCSIDNKYETIFKTWFKQILMSYELDFCHINFIDSFFSVKQEIVPVKNVICNVCLDIINEKLKTKLSIATKNYYEHCQKHILSFLKNNEH